MNPKPKPHANPKPNPTREPKQAAHAELAAEQQQRKMAMEQLREIREMRAAEGPEGQQGGARAAAAADAASRAAHRTLITPHPNPRGYQKPPAQATSS